MIFNKYAKYYDELYEDKRYGNECLLVEETIEKYMEPNKRKSMVDLGCGTGTHAAIFKEIGYDVVGIDNSIEMIKQAREKNNHIEFINGDVTNFKLEKPVDIAVSLFHVVSYLTSITDLNNFFKSVYDNTKDNALLIFDVWCGHGVLTDPPVVREKILKSGAIRIARPKVNLGEQTVAINYTIKDGNKTIKETHTMRYFFKQELELLLNKNGFDLVEMTNLTSTTWNMYVVAVKK